MDDRLRAYLEQRRPELAARAREAIGSLGEDDRDLLARLAPAERLGYVLHDLCGVPVAEVARILGRSPTATGRLADRARRRVATPDLTWDAERAVAGRVVEAFLAAAHAGDLEELAWLLHPDATLWSDAAAPSAGADAVAAAFAGLARRAQPAVLDGFPAAAVDRHTVLGLTVVDGKVAAVEVLTDPRTIARSDVG